MSVEINPSSQLGFPRPLTQVVKRSLYVTNSNSQPVAFKVKTTAPKQYCVRPNSGRIEPGERVEVQIVLQPLKEEPPMNAKCRDKFLIQSARIPADKETLPIAEFWSAQESDKSAISEHKVRCVYLPASSEPLMEESEDTSSAAPAYNAAALGTAGGAGLGYTTSTSSQAQARHTGAEPPVSIASLRNTVPVASSTNGATDSSLRSTTAPAAGSARDVTSSSDPQVAELQDQIMRLRMQLAEREKLDTTPSSLSASSARTATQKAASTGVPVHIVAAIAIGVFAITYLFF